MTNREFYIAISNIEGISADLKAFADEAIGKLDHRNEARKSKPSKATLANEPVRKAIAGYLADHPKTLSVDVANALGISTAKMTSLASRMVAEGVLTSAKVKVKGKGEQTVWSVAPDCEGVQALPCELAD